MSQIRNPVAPNLPSPPAAYDSGYHSRQNNDLRLFFNQITNALQQLLLGFNNYGTFYDTTNQTAVAANTAYPVTFNTTAENYGISPITTSRFQVSRAGVYNVQFVAQFDNSGGGIHHAHLWFRVNGVDVAASASKTVVNGPTDERTVSRNYLLTMQAGDYFELFWSVENTAVFLLHEAATAPVPEVPSVYLTANYLFPNSAA